MKMKMTTNIIIMMRVVRSCGWLTSDIPALFVALNVWEGYRRRRWHPFVANSGQPWNNYSAKYTTCSELSSMSRLRASHIWEALQLPLPVSVSIKPQIGEQNSFQDFPEAKGQGRRILPGRQIFFPALTE